MANWPNYLAKIMKPLFPFRGHFFYLKRIFGLWQVSRVPPKSYHNSSQIYWRLTEPDGFKRWPLGLIFWTKLCVHFFTYLKSILDPGKVFNVSPNLIITPCNFSKSSPGLDVFKRWLLGQASLQIIHMPFLFMF